MNFTVGEYLAVFGLLLRVLYGSWRSVKHRIASQRGALGVFYAGVLLLFAIMVYGFVTRNWWLFFGSMVLHGLWMAWIRKRMEGDDKDSE